ncbi:thioredoxin domain-containing protein [Maribellus sp. YY47]|uniref:thioredoxin domain-containing protein n=1 Tax=Maribellus sp. YY47 TaxID=2929486 RepID=UPI0020012256|nr:thioredoxin domain-containing protein [Maribellus sp. YY47]MCK3684773.1 thioredoxin domain-containing protein [Maribellus sp. YY47]
MKYTNRLIHETSPYLLQHAHNPVNWHPWSEALIEEAKAQDKLILISIGYAACHWCHVMEHESFEDEEVAEVMNAHFVCIKVDREERPDVDHYYMSAVQLMGMQGGWPLNVIALPDGRPIWGGTYFPKENWVKSLNSVAGFYRENKAKTKEYGTQLEESIRRLSLSMGVEDNISVNRELLENGVEAWKSRFDTEEGGRMGAPKFPMPVNLDFLMYYGWIKKDETVLTFVNTWLEKMARGGIYDQVGGGFARYSVDEYWKVPHFEKMLYDNGQLLSVYSKGYQLYKNEEFKTVVYELVHFLEREMLDESGAFYSSLDADSEGEEGRFYVWRESELSTLLGDEYPVFAAYYHVNAKGYWEHGNYILLRDGSDEAFAEANGMSLEHLHCMVSKWKYKLLKARSNRVRPGLDDKTLTSWNVMAVQGLVDAYNSFRENNFLELALKNARFISEHQMQSNGKLYHSWKKGKSTIDGFLEDYAFVIQAFLSLFETTGDITWAERAAKMMRYVNDHFFDEERGLFYFSEKNATTSVGNHFQNEDNVIPASNSVMANNLHRMYLLYGRPEYLTTIKTMLKYITPNFTKYPMAYAHWGNVMLKLTEPYFEVAVCGINSNILLKKLHKDYRPNTLLAHCSDESELPLLKGRFVKGDDLIYVCREGMCQLPVRSSEEAINLLAI